MTYAILPVGAWVKIPLHTLEGERLRVGFITGQTRNGLSEVKLQSGGYVWRTGFELIPIPR